MKYDNLTFFMVPIVCQESGVGDFIRGRDNCLVFSAMILLSYSLVDYCSILAKRIPTFYLFKDFLSYQSCHREIFSPLHGVHVTFVGVLVHCLLGRFENWKFEMFLIYFCGSIWYFICKTGIQKKKITSRTTGAKGNKFLRVITSFD